MRDSVQPLSFHTPALETKRPAELAQRLAHHLSPLASVVTCRYSHYVADDNKQPMNIRIDPDLVDALTAIKDAEGIPVSEQIRRGIRLWLDQKGATPKAKRATKSSRGKRS